MNTSYSLKHSYELKSLKIPYNDPDIINLISKQLYEPLSSLSPDQELVIVCIGTDRSTGDALGPLVGTNLSKFNHNNLNLYGTLAEPVHALNLNDTLNHIEKQHQNPFIIAIDACLGKLASVGCIQLGNGPLKPGAGVNKDLPSVGNIHMTGIVNVGGFMEYFVLQNTRLSLVVNMAEIIAKALYISLMNCRIDKTAATTFLQLDR